MKKPWFCAVVLFFVCAAWRVLPAAAGDGLVLRLPLNEGEGARALDVSGSDSHGGITEPEWAEDAQRGEHVLNFRGASVRVPHDESLSLEDELTVAAWIKLNEYGGYFATHVLRKWTGTHDANYAWYIFGSHGGANPALAGLLQLHANAGGTWGAVTPSYKLEPGRWYHAAAVYHKDRGGQLYINGEKVSERPSGRRGKLAVNEADILITRGDRLQSDVRVYNRALSEEEIMKLVQAEMKIAESIQLISLAGAHDGAKISGAKENMKVADGRMEGVKAVYLEGCDLIWGADVGGNYFIEYWMKPSGWDAAAEEDIEIAGFRAGGADYRIYKAGGESRLVLESGGEVLALYPVYGWAGREWMDAASQLLAVSRSSSVGVAIGESEKWGYVNISFSGEALNFSVNGFPAHVVSPSAGGALEEFTLKGSEGTFFSELRIVRGSLPEGGVMARYPHIYRSLSAPAIMEMR